MISLLFGDLNGVCYLPKNVLRFDVVFFGSLDGVFVNSPLDCWVVTKLDGHPVGIFRLIACFDDGGRPVKGIGWVQISLNEQLLPRCKGSFGSCICHYYESSLYLFRKKAFALAKVASLGTRTYRAGGSFPAQTGRFQSRISCAVGL